MCGLEIIEKKRLSGFQCYSIPQRNQVRLELQVQESFVGRVT